MALLGTLGCATGDVRVATADQHQDKVAPPAQSAAQAPPAAPTADARPAEPENKGDDPKPEAVPIPDSALVHGRATMTVNAPIKKVREVILDFSHYAEFMPHYQASKLLGRTADGARDVYMEIEALNGLVKMWAEIEMPKPTIKDGVEVHESKFVKGNVKDFKAIWRVKKVDDASTELSLEVFLDPSIPLPNGVINNENLKGSVKGVKAMKARIEKM